VSKSQHGTTQTRWIEYIEDLGRNRLGLQPSASLEAEAVVALDPLLPQLPRV